MEPLSSPEIAAPKIPWPGPKPYEEVHWKQFLGRGEVMEHLLGRVRVAKITVLLGESGSGKTSLIRAGVVPLLRLDRYHPTGPRTAWPVFVLREGSARGEGTVEVSWLQQLKSAIAAIENWSLRPDQDEARQDAEFFGSILEKRGTQPLAQGGFVGLIEEMAWEEVRRAKARTRETGSDTESGLILVFDQFEEQLRAGAAAQKEAFRLIRDIVKSNAPTRVLLSMRKEFRLDLRDLEILIGELGRSSIYLKRLRSPSVVQIIGEVSDSADISIERNVAKRIVSWLTPRDHGPGKLREDHDKVDGEESDVDEGSAETPDLLKLQAVLVELCRWAARKKEPRVTMRLFEQFVLELGGGLGKDLSPSNVGKGSDGRVTEIGGDSNAEETQEERLGQKVLGGALERWIESAITGEFSDSLGDRPSHDIFSASIPNDYGNLSTLDPDFLHLQVRRIAVRLAPLLSSADYKVAQEENALFQQALGDEISKLGIQDGRHLSKIEIIEGPEPIGLHLDWEALGGLKKIDAQERWAVLSGPARKESANSEGWTLEETGDRILACFKEALTRMANANILRKNTLSQGGKRKNYWELVHDQFGPNLIRWAERQRGTWDDCKSSLVVCRGVQPLAVSTEEIGPVDGKDGKEYYEVDSVSWQGCGVQQAWSGKLVLRNVRFRDCYFVGTIFDGIEFVGCSFENCRLTGALFRKCSFWLTVFKDCHSNIAIIDGTIRSLKFKNCQLNQPAIKNVTLEGNIVYAEGSKVIQGLFEKITVEPGRDPFILVESDSSAAYCFVSKQCFSLLRVEREDPTLPNSPLPDEFRTGL